MPKAGVLRFLLAEPDVPVESDGMIRSILLNVGLITAFLSTAQAQWYASADFLVSTRTMSSVNTFARNSVEETDAMGMGTGTFLSGSESRLSLDFVVEPAGRLTIGNRVNEFGFEATYLATGKMGDFAWAYDAGGVLSSPFAPINTLLGPLDNNSQIAVGYSTELQSLELSFTHLAYLGPNGEATLLYGVRTLQIEEDFGYEGINAGGTNTLDSLRDNRLIGPQFGIDAWTPVPGGSVRMNVSGAVAYNNIKWSEVTTGAGWDGGGFAADGSTDRATLIGELGIEYRLQPTSCLTLTIGYQFLGLSDVGLATHATPLSQRFTDHVLYHQPYCGVLITH